MMNKITFTKQEKNFLKTCFSKKFLKTCADALESAISRIVKAYNNKESWFSYHNINNDERGIYIIYNFAYSSRKQADFVSVDINIDGIGINDYINIDFIKNKRISNKYDLYEVTAKVSNFMRKELNYEK